MSMKMNSDNIQIISSKNKVTIILSNELTIYTIENIKDEIIKAVNKYDDIEISSNNIKNMDLTFVQLINSIQKSAIKKGKKLNVNIELNEENKILFENTNITRIIIS